MRVVTLVLLVAACGKKDETKPYVELSATLGDPARKVAALVPLLKERGTPFDAPLALYARKEIVAIAKPATAPLDNAPAAALASSLKTLGFDCELPIYGPDRNAARCRTAATQFEKTLASVADGARQAEVPAETIAKFETPDAGTKQKLDKLLAALEPGPKGKAWDALKKAETADDKALEDACKEAAEEAKARLSKDPIVEEILPRAQLAGSGDCLALMSVSVLMELTKTCFGGDTPGPGCNKAQTCTLVKRNLEFIDRVPKKYAAALTDAGKRCGS